MEHTARWDIEVFLFEHDDSTRAQAVLHTGSTTMSASGLARRNPHDRPVPEIGDELAVGRALNELARQLMSVAADDIAAVAG